MDRCTCGRHRRPIATQAQRVASEIVLEHLAWEATQNPDVEARAFARREYERRMAWLPQTLRNLDLDKYYGDEVRDCPEARRPAWDYEHERNAARS